MFLNGRRQRHFLRCAPVAILGLPRKVDNTDIMTAHESVRFFFLSYLTNAGQDPHQDNFSASRYVEGGSRPSPTVCWVRLRACTVNKRRVLRLPFCFVRHPTRGVEGAALYRDPFKFRCRGDPCARPQPDGTEQSCPDGLSSRAE